jgi:predicted amidophosphoribosyltransferase
MSILAISPIKLPGPWSLGFALDKHIQSSDFLGYDGAGHSQFDTTRTELGEAVFLIKYRSDRSRVGNVADTAVNFIREHILPSHAISVICPVPPSNAGRSFQPVIAIAQAIGESLSIPVDTETISRQPSAVLAKDLTSHEERWAMVVKGLAIQPAGFAGKTVLLLDDLYQTGATAETIAKACTALGGASAVIFIAITKTRN